MEIGNLVTLEYTPLDWEEKSFSARSLEMLEALLTIRKEGNLIYICHPKHIFDMYVEDGNTKEVKRVNFRCLNVERMFKYNDCGRYSMVDQMCSKTNNQLTYLLKRASHMIKKQQQAGLSLSYPLAVLEEDHSDFEVRYIARGIVSCDEKGIRVAFNPEVIKTPAKETVWQKGLRFGDNSSWK